MIDTQCKCKNLQIGHRVKVQDDIGTIKYIGALAGQKGIWLGLDWDDPCRGKHDGSINGKSYFIASSTTSGSFLRPEKVFTGISVIESITSRYGHQADEAEIQYNQFAFKAFKKKANIPFLQCIGFDNITLKQSDYKKLQVLDVRRNNVSHIGDINQLSIMCPNIKEFDLSNNLMHSWEEVFNLAAELKYLNNLNISENKLHMPDEISMHKVTHLKTLVCGKMHLTWVDIEQLGQVFPNLETVIAPSNKISSLELNISLKGIFQQLKTLDLEGNTISDWSEIMKLKHLPSLEVLHLNNLSITHIRIDGDGDAFKTLQKLNLKHNLIADLESLSNLNKLKGLKSLGLLGNPLYKMDLPANVDQIIIAMVGSIQVLNNSEHEQRKGAEIDYMKKFGLEWLRVQGNGIEREKFLTIHTRLLELIAKYGALEESELKVEAKTIKESLIELIFIHKDQQVKKKVPPTMQVQKLVTLCQRLFQLPIMPTLSYQSEGQTQLEIDLEENRDISLYSLQTGDKIVVKC